MVEGRSWWSCSWKDSLKQHLLLEPAKVLPKKRVVPDDSERKIKRLVESLLIVDMPKGWGLVCCERVGLGAGFEAERHLNTPTC